jgi:outer membrane protein
VPPAQPDKGLSTGFAGKNPKENPMNKIAAMHLMVLLLLALSSSVHAYGVNHATSDVHQELMAADEAKFAVVDVQEVLTLSSVGKEAKEELDSAVMKVETERKIRENELNRLKAELTESGYPSEATRGAAQKALEYKLQEYQLYVGRITEELRLKNTELTKGVVEKILKVVQDYGRRKGFLCIFFKNESMMYLNDKVDITGAILQELNAMQVSGLKPGISH